jgi:hypothetical protein
MAGWLPRLTRVACACPAGAAVARRPGWQRAQMMWPGAWRADRLCYGEGDMACELERRVSMCVCVGLSAQPRSVRREHVHGVVSVRMFLPALRCYCG